MSARAKHCLIFSIFSLLLIYPPIAHADLIPDALKGEKLLFQRNYDAGIELFKQIEQDYPASPTGSFGQMAAWQVRMFENLDFRFASEYEEVEKKFEATVRQMLQYNPSSWDLFISGAGYGMRGFYYAREGKWFRALGSAIRAIQLLKRLAWQDKDFVDAYLGIGMYQYWRSVMTSGLSFLPFFGDHRQDGIAQVERVAKDGKYANELAKANLIFMFAQEKEFDKAREIVDKFLAEYPNNVILRQISGSIYYDTKQYPKAVAEYKKMLEIDPAMTKALFRLGRIYTKKIGGEAESRKYFEQFLATNPEKEWAEVTKKQLELLQ